MITFSDGKKIKIDYAPKTQFVSEITNKDGLRHRYKFGTSGNNPKLNYWTEIKSEIQKDKWIHNKLEFFLKNTKDDRLYTQKIIQNKQGVITERVFESCCYLPVEVKKGNITQYYKYNDVGLLNATWKRQKEKKIFDYDSKKKLIKVSSGGMWTLLKYNKKGLLQQISNSKDEQINFVYNFNNYITKFIYKKNNPKLKSQKRIYTYNYDLYGRPIKIGINKVGNLKLSYSKENNLKNVKGNNFKILMENLSDAMDVLNKMLAQAIDKCFL